MKEFALSVFAVLLALAIFQVVKTKVLKIA